MATGQSEITLRFLAAPTEVATLGGSIHGGRVLEWIDKAGYAAATRWSGRYCVTAYVGNVRFTRPVEVGHLVEVRARIVRTGRSSMDVLVETFSGPPSTGELDSATHCLMVFVAVDDRGTRPPCRRSSRTGRRAGCCSRGRSAGPRCAPRSSRPCAGRSTRRRARRRA